MSEVIDYSVWLEGIVEQLEGIHQLLVNVNGYLYILLFVVVGGGLIYLMYRFLKIFL